MAARKLLRRKRPKYLDIDTDILSYVRKDIYLPPPETDKEALKEYLSLNKMSHIDNQTINGYKEYWKYEHGHQRPVNKLSILNCTLNKEYGNKNASAIKSVKFGTKISYPTSCSKNLLPFSVTMTLCGNKRQEVNTLFWIESKDLSKVMQ